MISDVRSDGLLCQSIVDDLFPVMHQTARLQVAAELRQEPSLDPMTRSVPCVRGQMTTPSWVDYRMRRSMRDAVRLACDYIAWQAMLSECQCGTCESARLRAVRAFPQMSSFPLYVNRIMSMPRFGRRGLELLAPVIEGARQPIPVQTEMPLPPSSPNWVDEELLNAISLAPSLPSAEHVTIAPAAQRVTPIRDISLEELSADRQATNPMNTL